MAIIYRKNTTRLTIAEAKRLLLDAMEPKEVASVYGRITSDGDIDADSLEVVIETTKAPASFIHDDFKLFCEELSIKPRMCIRPTVTGYPDRQEMDDEYTITHDEFVAIASAYPGLQVEVQAEALAIETTEPRQDTETLASKDTNKVWTDAFKAEVRAYRDKHGLKATAEHFGKSQSLISKHVPAGKPKKTVPHPFTGLGKR